VSQELEWPTTRTVSVTRGYDDHYTALLALGTAPVHIWMARNMHPSSEYISARYTSLPSSPSIHTVYVTPVSRRGLLVQ
jgi:hypothetical protein